MFSRIRLTRLALLFSLSLVGCQTDVPPQNVIIFLGDGMGKHCYKRLQLPREGAYETMVQTFSLTSGVREFNPREYAQDSSLRYKKPTDSAASGTALSSGHKTENAYLNCTPDGHRLMSMAERMKKRGKDVAILTSVPLSHATPAAYGGAHNSSRHNYAQIAHEMLADTVIDLWMGGGHFAYDENGRKLHPSRYNYNYMGGLDNVQALQAGTHPQKWRFFDDFTALHAVRFADTDRVLFVAPVRETLQAKRAKNLSRQPHLGGIEHLATFAFDFLQRRQKPFFMMIEGGAIDYMNHANDLKRMEEETDDFNAAVLHVFKCLDRNTEKGCSPNWHDTLVIITADHETGGIDCVNGRYVYTTNNHTNDPVPLYVRGAGKAHFRRLPKQAFGGIDNTDIPRTIEMILSQ